MTERFAATTHDVSSRARPSIRRDIQALRALAVGLVVVYHLFPSALPGGFVGVDVFFVVSGFLITGHLLREHAQTGTIRIGTFYLRRARRLLPASLTVLALCLVAVVVFFPPSVVEQNIRGIVASALYVQNWALSFDAVDYLQLSSGDTIAQHFWTLSLEEQFYLVWPLALLGAGYLITRSSRSHLRGWYLLFAGVLLFSLAFSIWYTGQSPAQAYFSTFTRLWEFAVGALLAVVGSHFAQWAPRWVRASLSWLGVGLIVLGAFLLSGSTPYPGAAALVPVLGTALVIVVAEQSRASAMVVGDWKLVQYLGDISYSVYLWHWPLIVAVPYVMGAPLGLREKVAIAAITVLLASLTREFVEKSFLSPTRSWKRWALVVSGALMAVVVTSGVGVIVSSAQERSEREAAFQDLIEGECFGASAMVKADCEAFIDAPTTILPSDAARDYADTTLDDCGTGITLVVIEGTPGCAFGPSSADTTMLLVGDSHAGHWIPALQSFLVDESVRLVTFVRSSCPFTAATPSSQGDLDTACASWKRAVLTYVEDEQPDVVLVASLAPYGYSFAGFDPGTEADIEAGYAETLSELSDTAAHVVVLRDTPYPAVSVPECLDLHGPAICRWDESEVLTAHNDALWSAAQRIDSVTRIDMTDLFCVDGKCGAVIGGAIVYRDAHHMTETYAHSAGTVLRERLASAGILAR